MILLLPTENIFFSKAKSLLLFTEKRVHSSFYLPQVPTGCLEKVKYQIYKK